MKKMLKYFSFLKEKGRIISEIAPGSTESALNTVDALEAIELLKESQTPIIGGDILSEENDGNLIYAYQLWGNEFHYLNWSCNKLDNEAQIDYVIRSYSIAKESIITANNIAVQLKKKCYIVFVI